MLNHLYSYFIFLFHPFVIHENLRLKREGQLFGQVKFYQTNTAYYSFVPLSLSEIILYSWPFSMIKAFYTFVGMHAGITSLKFIQDETQFSSSLLSFITFSEQKIVIFTTIFNVILFPLSAWAFAKIWKIIIEFFTILFKSENNNPQALDQVVNLALGSYTFWMLPILGGLLKFICFHLYLFAGLTRNLQLTVVQSLFVLFSPLLFLSIFFMVIASSVLMLFSVV